MNKWLWIGLGITALGAFLVWLFVASSKPLPGTRIADLGREHVSIGEKVDYNSNPPTSGPHYEEWIRAGVYEIPKDDRNLVHSLEHGYVIMHYNCSANSKLKTPASRGEQNSKLFEVYAHGVEEEASVSAQEGSPSATLSQAFRSEDCHKLVDQLISVYEKKGKKKLIVIPRPNLDSRIALTAWNYLDKFNEFDEQRVTRFIDAHRDQGPERTME